jgi:hypothetical protein
MIWGMLKGVSRRRIALGTAVLLVLGAGGFAVWMALVRAGVVRYNKWDRRERGTLRVGDPAPDLQVAAYDGSTLRLGSLWAERPVMLVFGSCT